MKNFFSKPYRWATIFSIILIGAFLFSLLDAFVIPKKITAVVGVAKEQTNITNESDTTNQTETDQSDASGQSDTIDQSDTTGQTDETSKSDTAGLTDTTDLTNTTDQSNTTDQVNSGNQTDNNTTTEIIKEPEITDTSYEDENIEITIVTIRQYDSTIYVADIQLSDASYLKTALAGNSYGRNIKATTSETAKDNNAILAINGDFYGFRDYGYVLRNGVLYRDSARNSGEDEALVIDTAGDFQIIEENKESIDDLSDTALWQILSFGPALIKEGQVVVDKNSEVSRSMSSNPRTAIGQISTLHYVIVVSDGRTDESAGLSLLELAQVFSDLGCTTAYNLDGGGSATMYFNGKIVNIPTDGRKLGEREVSDIVYIGY